MGYLFLTFSLLAGLAKGYCGKRTSGYVNEYRDAMLANAVRMVLCIAIGFGITCLSGGMTAFRLDAKSLWVTILSGIATSVFVVSWLVSVKSSAYMLVNVFLMMGMIVPLLGSSILFGESISLRQWAGLCILLIAVIIMCSYNASIKGKMGISAFIVLTVCGISSGFADFSQKLFVEFSNKGSVAAFNFYTYVFSAVVLMTCWLFMTVQSKEKQNKAILKPIWGYIAVMSVCLFANTYFQTKAAEFLPSVLLFPLSKGAGLISSSLMSSILFKERLTVKCIMGMALSFAALLIINL